jgi:hypothetical protein
VTARIYDARTWWRVALGFIGEPPRLESKLAWFETEAWADKAGWYATSEAAQKAFYAHDCRDSHQATQGEEPGELVYSCTTCGRVIDRSEWGA